MIGTTRNVRVFACTEPIDLRRGYDGLFALARDVLERDPLSGHAFLFVSRSRKRCKVLIYDGTGLCIFMKRIERGRFVAPWSRGTGRVIEMTMSELAVWRGDDPHKLQLELIKLQELVNQRNHALFGGKSERRSTSTSATEADAGVLGRPVCSDPDDDTFLACAVAGRADCVVTGERALLATSGYRGVEVMTPAAFLKRR